MLFASSYLLVSEDADTLTRFTNLGQGLTTRGMIRRSEDSAEINRPRGMFDGVTKLVLTRKCAYGI